MANRPVFAVGNERNLCQVHNVEFQWYPGLSKSQRMKSSMSLRGAFLANHKDHRVLEISRYSESHLGMALSAFNLTVTTKEGKELSVECAYQGSKIMKEYGQLKDLYDVTSMEARKDPRRENGTLVGFLLDGEEFGLHPKTAFYNWVYIRALQEHPELGDELMEYDAFVDIVFNPLKSTSCQAEACAYYVALRRQGVLEEAMKDRESFLRILYHVGSSAKREVKTIKPETSLSQTEVKTEKEVPTVILRTGDVVKHPKFGDGVIVAVSEDKEPAILTVKFSVGEKMLSKDWLVQMMNKLK